MTDVVSFELLLDERSEAGIRAEWDALAAAGLSSLGSHPSVSNRPHITMLVRGELGTPARPVLTEAVPLPLPVALGAPILFGTGERRVLARSVLVSSDLLRMHAALHRIAGEGDDAPHTRPGEWTPHLTLARRLRIDDLPRALRILDEVRESGGADLSKAVAVGLRRWDSVDASVTMLLAPHDLD